MAEGIQKFLALRNYIDENIIVKESYFDTR